MTLTIGWSSGDTEGTSMISSQMPPSSSGSRSVTAMTMPSRALTSCRLLFTFSNTVSLPVAMATTGISLSIRAMGPCFISPAG